MQDAVEISVIMFLFTNANTDIPEDVHRCTLLQFIIGLLQGVCESFAAKNEDETFKCCILITALFCVTRFS